jgi:hypothetical protein
LGFKATKEPLASESAHKNLNKNKIFPFFDEYELKEFYGMAFHTITILT